MGKLPALALLILLIGTNYPEAEAFSFGSIFNVGSIVKNVIGTIADIVGVFVPQKMAPDHSKEYIQFENDLLKQNNRLKKIYEKVDDAKERTVALEKKLGKTAEFFKSIDVHALNRDIQVMDMMNRMDDVVKNTNILTYSVTDLLADQVTNTAHTAEVTNSLDVRMKSLHIYIVEISDTFERLIERLTGNTAMSSQMVKDLMSSVLTFKAQQPKDIMMNIWSLFNTGETSSISDTLPNYFIKYAKQQTYKEKCDLSSTFQDKLKAIYNVLIMTEIRAFVMQVVAYKYLAITDPETNGNIKNDVNRCAEELITRCQEHIRTMKITFKRLPTEIMRCDPAVHLKDDNNFELNNLFGAYYMNVAQLDNKCGVTCGTIDVKRELECVSVSESQSGDVVPHYCPQFQCKGKLHSCTTANSLKFCESRIPNEQRYKWITSNADESMISDCDGNYINTMTRTSCDSCLCMCSAEGAESNATRAVSLLPQISDYKNNKVVTNVRFQKKDNVVHMQIQEGELLPEGKITVGSQKWVPLKDFVYSRNTPEGSFSIVEGNDLVPLIPDSDFTYLSYDNRKLMLHDIKVDSDKVVTGVRFFLKKGDKYESNKLIIRVHATKFDYFTGKVIHEKPGVHEWFDINNSYCTDCNTDEVNEVELNNRKNPMESLANNDVTKSNQFVQFRASGNDNSGHLTIPFFDARPAGIVSHTALSGLGIFHRSSRGYGGFLAPKLLGMDHSFAMAYEVDPDKLDSWLWR